MQDLIMEKDKLLKRCEDLANQFRKECEPILKNVGFYCSEIFNEFIGNIIAMNKNWEECKKFFEDSKKESDMIKMMQMLGKARIHCVMSANSADNALNRLIDLERYLCAVTGIEGYKRKIESDKRVIDGMKNKIEAELMKVWKK
jgi:hypothetical protein